jgi:hypothetical protein
LKAAALEPVRPERRSTSGTVKGAAAAAGEAAVAAA